MSRRLIHWLVLLGLVAAFLAVTGLRIWMSEQAAGPGARQRPGFTLPNLAGEPRSIERWDGQVVVLNFWATWCPPCVEEIPELVGFQAAHGGRGVQVLGVALDDRQAAAAFVEQMSVNYPVLHGVTEGYRVLERYGNERGTLPYTVIIDPDGAIRHRLPRPTDAAELARLVAPLL